MNNFIKIFGFTILMAGVGCAHNQATQLPESEAARIDRKLVKETVVFEPGSKEGAVVPDISAPRLRAIWVPERQENGRLIEAHREWSLEGDVAILGVPKQQKAVK